MHTANMVLSSAPPPYYRDPAQLYMVCFSLFKQQGTFTSGELFIVVALIASKADFFSGSTERPTQTQGVAHMIQVLPGQGTPSCTPQVIQTQLGRLAAGHCSTSC